MKNEPNSFDYCLLEPEKIGVHFDLHPQMSYPY